MTECLILSIEYGARVLIKWDIKDTSQNLSSVFFSIYRGESPSEMMEISTAPIPANTLYEYIDTTAKLKMITKNYYYKVVAKEIIDGVVVNNFESQPFTWQGNVDLVAMYIIEEHNFAYEHVYGVPVFIYKRRKEGTRCTNCWDSVLKRVTKSNCTICLGTGFVNGYYAPIASWMDFNPDPMVAQIPDFGVKEPSQTDIQFTNYPLLGFNDIILELEPLRFWRVTNTRNTEKDRTTILQVARVDEINRSDIEQQLNVNQELRQVMLDSLNNRQKITEF